MIVELLTCSLCADHPEAAEEDKEEQPEEGKVAVLAEEIGKAQCEFWYLQ